MSADSTAVIYEPIFLTFMRHKSYKVLQAPVGP